jgi:hypothetical protein
MDRRLRMIAAFKAAYVGMATGEGRIKNGS